jgi:hypothetical protein
MDLSILFKKLVSRLDRLRDRAAFIESSALPYRDWRRVYWSEAIVQDLWTVWNAFARHFVVFQCTGCTNRVGTVIACRPDSPTKTRVIYESSVIARSGVPKPKTASMQRYMEPTWGDPDRLANILSRIGAVHGPLMEAILLSNRGSVKHIQLVRNACAHRSRESLDYVLAIQQDYIIRYAVRNASDLCWQDYGSANASALYRWISDVENVADLLTNAP